MLLMLHKKKKTLTKIEEMPVLSRRHKSVDFCSVLPLLALAPPPFVGLGRETVVSSRHNSNRPSILLNFGSFFCLKRKDGMT